eukprot:INCI19837.1.p1 GENE.INCI19837.1~~INCI19837.1.p1  ORF type:complete len:438 (-),score=83.60 INCI19837.1:470-1783(-)
MTFFNRLMKFAVRPRSWGRHLKFQKRAFASYLNSRHELQNLVEELGSQYKIALQCSNYESLKAKAQVLDDVLSSDNVWIDEPTKAARTMRTRAQLEGRLSKVDKMKNAFNEVTEYAALVLDDIEHEHGHSDWSAFEECLAEVKQVADDLDEFVRNSLVDPTSIEANDCLLMIEAGNGGLDAKDWVTMLQSMYTAWAEAKGFEVEEVSSVPDKVAGLRSCILEIKGTADADCAYGWTRTESGVHKLVRFSPFDKAHRRHTSHATVAAIPVHHEDRSTFSMDKKDLRIERFRSSGPGGQHANTTDSAVRITHIPTGLTASAQESRSQHDNLETAMSRLRNQLWVREEQNRILETNMYREASGVGSGASWGDHIRQYVLNPQQYVKDVRTNLSVEGAHAVDKVLLDGELDDFIHAALLLDRKHKLQENSAPTNQTAADTP